jgi:hypothetical protein
MNRLFFIVLFTLSVCTNVFSQTQSVAYPAVGKGVATTFVTDYHCLGINSSALGWGTGYKDKKFTMGSSEFAFGMYSDILTSKKLNNLYGAVKNSFIKKDVNSLDVNSQKEAIADYSQAGVSMFFDYNWGGFSFQGKRFGGIAINVRESYQYYSKFNQQTTDIIFRGKISNYFDSLTIVVGLDTSRIANSSNISEDSLKNVVSGSLSVPLHLSEITNGSEVKMVWNRFYNIGYGRKILGIDSVFVLYGGVGGRYIQSMAMFNLRSDENGLVMYSSITPSFNIDYGSIAATNPSDYSSVKKGLPKAMGDGYGVDLSASIILFSKLKVAASINNVGQVTYNRNVYSVKDTFVTNLSLGGMANYDITQSINQMLTDGGLLTLEGKEKYVLKNASDFRFGASFQPWKFINFGFDMIAPFNKENPGSIQNPVYSFGGEIKPFKWVSLSAGYFGGGIYQDNVPVGINFILRDGAYEVGVSSRDALTFFAKDKHSLSAAFGFARFRF